MATDREVTKQTFTTKKEAQEWASKTKEENKPMGTLRHSIKEVLNAGKVRWEATVYIRGKKVKK